MKIYLGWEITEIRNGAYKATKNGTSMNSCNEALLLAMVRDHEGVQKKPEDKLPENREFRVLSSYKAPKPLTKPIKRIRTFSLIQDGKVLFTHKREKTVLFHLESIVGHECFRVVNHKVVREVPVGYQIIRNDSLTA